MRISNLTIQGKRVFLLAFLLFVGQVYVFLLLLARGLQASSNGIFLAASCFFISSIIALLYLLNLLLGKKDIVCCDNTISIKSSFILTKAKEKKYKISDVDCLLLQCEESERSEIRDIFCSHIRMSIIPIYYDVKIEQTGELILRFNDKQTALRFFDYIAHEFSENNKKIDFGQEERILNARHRLLLLMSKSFFLFCSIMTFFFSLILFFCSYGIYSDYSKNFWKKSNILVENTKSNDHVSVIIQDEAESNSKLVCSVLSSDLIALQNAAKKGKK